MGREGIESPRVLSMKSLSMEYSSENVALMMIFSYDFQRVWGMFDEVPTSYTHVEVLDYQYNILKHQETVIDIQKTHRRSRIWQARSWTSTTIRRVTTIRMTKRIRSIPSINGILTIPITDRKPLVPRSVVVTISRQCTSHARRRNGKRTATTRVKVEREQSTVVAHATQQSYASAVVKHVLETAPADVCRMSSTGPVGSDVRKLSG